MEIVTQERRSHGVLLINASNYSFLSRLNNLLRSHGAAIMGLGGGSNVDATFGVMVTKVRKTGLSTQSSERWR